MINDAADRVIGLYRRHAAAFDRARSRALFERHWLDRFAALAGPAAELLDLGCGSGEPIARHLIAQGHAVTGVDSSPGLLALARQRFPAQSWIEADMRTLALGRRFAGLIAWHSLFHLTPDAQRAMFPILAAHAQPGGALMFTSGTVAGVSIGAYQGEALYHASLDSDAYRAALTAAGFEVIEHAVDDQSCGGTTLWLARRRD